MASKSGKRLTRRTSVFMLGGIAGSALLAACGEVEIRYVQGPAGPAGAAGAQGEKGAAGAAGAAGSAGQAGETIVVEKPVVVEKVVERVVEVAAPTKQRVQLLYWNGWRSTHRFSLGTNEVIRDFLGKQDGVAVEIGEAGGGQNMTKIKAALAADTPPHAWFNWQVPTSDLYNLGATIDFNEALKTKKDWATISGDLVPFLVEGTTWKGHLTMVPMIPDAHALGFNKHILAKEGIDFPQEGYTWADFDEIGTKIFIPGERALSDFRYDGHRLLWYMGSNGTFPLDQSRTKFQWNTPETIETFEYAHNHSTRTGYFINEFPEGNSNANFNAGGRLTNIINAGTVTPPRYPDIDPGDGSGIQITHYPLGPSNASKTPMTPGNVFGIVVFKGHPSAEQDMAAELVLHSVRPEVQLLVSAASGHPPSNLAAARDPNITKALRDNPILNKLNELTQFDRPTPNPPSYLQVLGIVKEHMTNVKNGDMVPKDALAEIQRLTQPMLDKDIG